MNRNGTAKMGPKLPTPMKSPCLVKLDTFNYFVGSKIDNFAGFLFNFDGLEYEKKYAASHKVGV